MNKLNESGRSMVEMLGVLAVVGVLSVGGFAALKAALNKHYANQTINRLYQRAMSISSQRLLGQEPSLSDFNTSDGKFEISNTITKDAESFQMTVNDVPQEICQIIKGVDWKIAKMIPEDCSETTLAFKFLNDLGDCSECVPESVDCSQYGTECGTCSVVKGFNSESGNQCTNAEKRYCVQGNCEVCPVGQIVYNNICTSCASLDNVDTENCHQCVDAQGNHTHFYIPGWTSTRCFKCSTENIYSGCGGGSVTTLAECNFCENRCFIDDGHCIEPGKVYGTCDYTAYAMDPKGDGHCKCADGYYLSGEYNAPMKCRSCSNINNFVTDPDDCHKCVDANDKHTHFFNTGYGKCYKCEDTGYSALNSTTLAECNLCENRCFASDNKCYIYGTDQTYTGKDANGYCTS